MTGNGIQKNQIFEVLTFSRWGKGVMIVYFMNERSLGF